MLHLRYGRTGYICIMEGHVTFALRKDRLHLRYGRTCYICVMEGHVTFALRKDMLHLGYGRTCYIWVTEGQVISTYDSYFSKLPAGPRFLGSDSDLKF